MKLEELKIISVIWKEKIILKCGCKYQKTSSSPGQQRYFIADKLDSTHYIKDLSEAVGIQKAYQSRNVHIHSSIWGIFIGLF